MNERNQVEEQLQSWTPRRPSSGLKNKLFADVAPEPEPEPIVWSRVFSWLVPATACFMVAFGLMKSEEHSGLFGSATNSTPAFFAMFGSNTVLMPLGDQEFQYANAGGNMALNVWAKASSRHAAVESSGDVPTDSAFRLLIDHLQ